MNKDILKNLTFGFEIEGMFKDGMDILLPQGNFVSDGSVNSLRPTFEAQHIPEDLECDECIRNDDGEIHSYCHQHHAFYHREGEVSTEYSSKVYDDFKECLKDLGKFDKDTHIWNQTCGLHFHVGYKGGKNKLYSTASNLEYLNSIITDAKTWCKCQKDRLEGSRSYFNDYSNSYDLVRSTKSNAEKYRVCRFHHDYGTLEFRFLSPCEHKVKNVTELVNNLTSYLGRNEKVHRETLVDNEVNIVPIMQINKKIKKIDLGELKFHLEPGIKAAQKRGQFGKVSRYQYAIDIQGRSVQTQPQTMMHGGQQYEMRNGEWRPVSSIYDIIGGLR